MKTLRTVVFMLIFYIVGGIVFFHEAEDFSWVGEWTRDTSVLSGLGPVIPVGRADGWSRVATAATRAFCFSPYPLSSPYLPSHLAFYSIRSPPTLPLDSIYFVITTLTTVGYGDMGPTTPTARYFRLVPPYYVPLPLPHPSLPSPRAILSTMP